MKNMQGHVIFPSRKSSNIIYYYSYLLILSFLFIYLFLYICVIFKNYLSHFLAELLENVDGADTYDHKNLPILLLLIDFFFLFFFVKKKKT